MFCSFFCTFCTNKFQTSLFPIPFNWWGRAFIYALFTILCSYHHPETKGQEHPDIDYCLIFIYVSENDEAKSKADFMCDFHYRCDNMTNSLGLHSSVSYHCKLILNLIFYRIKFVLLSSIANVQRPGFMVVTLC